MLDPLVRHWLRNGSMVRVKIWTPAGMVLYSDEPRLIGQTFALEPGARSALLSPRTDADVSDLRLPENRFERSDGKLLEVYRPVWTPDGQPLLFETYFRYDMVSQRSHQLWRAFAGVMLSCLVALVILLAGVGWLLLVRARRARAEREQLISRALAASDEERRRIAATLHDGVVQQLVAASFMAAGQAQRAASAADARGRPPIGRRPRQRGRPAVALVDIYPPSLRAPGWPARCATSSRRSGHDAAVVADIDAEAADAVPEPQQEMMFRIAQEALRNAVRHAGAGPSRSAWPRTTRAEPARDPRRRPRLRRRYRAGEGHFGLRLMADAARHGGGGCRLSAPGAGTRVRYEVTAP